MNDVILINTKWYMNASKPDRSMEYRPGPENGRPGPGVSRYSRPGPLLSGPVWGSNCSEEKKFLCVFFAFQAIPNTFYFWVKNLEKKYSKSQEDTPPPHNWKNILYLYFMFYAILSTFQFFWKNKYLIGTAGLVKSLPARSDFVVFINKKISRRNGGDEYESNHFKIVG